jgi:hypothetical protein
MLCVLRRAARSGSGLHGRDRGDVDGEEAVLSRFPTYGSFDGGNRIGCKVRLVVAQIGEVERPEFVVDAVPSIAMLELLKIRRVRSGKDVKRELGPSFVGHHFQLAWGQELQGASNFQTPFSTDFEA